MPADTKCEYCGTRGFVRWERIIERGDAATQFYCGRCQRSWRIPEGDRTEPPPRNKRDAPPDR